MKHYVIFQDFSEAQQQEIKQAPSSSAQITLGEGYHQQLAKEITEAFPEVRVTQVAYLFIHLEIPDDRPELVDAIKRKTGRDVWPSTV